MIILTNYTKKQVRKEIGQHYMEGFFRRVTWVDIQYENFWRLFTAGALEETKDIEQNLFSIAFWLFYFYKQTSIEQEEENKLIRISL